MEAGFLNFHGEEHFSTIDSSYFLDPSIGDDTGSYDGEHSYNWDWDSERELNGDIGLIPVSGNAAGDYCIMSTSPPSKEDFHKIMMEWQQLVNIETENVEELAIDVVTSNALDTAQPQDIVDETETKNFLSNTNEIDICDTASNLSGKEIISSIADLSENNSPPMCNINTQELTEADNNATIGTKLNNIEDLYNTLDPIGHLANSDFDITKYVNETEKYSKNPEMILPSGPGPGGKRLDLKNQRYVVSSYSDDSEDDHIDVETVSETNLSADLDDDDAVSSGDEEDEKAKLTIEPDKILNIKYNMEKRPENTFVDIDGESVPIIDDYKMDICIKQESQTDLPPLSCDIIEQNLKDKIAPLEVGLNNMIDDLDMKNANLELDKKIDNILDIDLQKIDSINMLDQSNNLCNLETTVTNTTSVETKVKIEIKPQISPVIEAGDLDSLLEQFEATSTNTEKTKTRKVIDEHKLQPKEGDEESKKDNSKSKQILEALPEELINRIKQSSKRKSISVIPPIPTKKRGKPAQGTVPINNSCDSVQMDHDYCISASSSKKDSGFSSCEEDERSILRNQPTIKTADGKLMVSLLKVNTIKKRKLNLEEYKQRRQGRSCSGSPARTEDENSRRLQRMNIQPCPPPNMDCKTLVSVGVNTDQSWGRLQEIVRGCPVNFSPNSLITSLVEHLPQVKDNTNYGGEHGEDKTIVYLDKNRVPVKTTNKHTQTITHRRSLSSSSSCSSRSSRSRTRSPSPCARRRRTSSEKIREVEERRVIYVGRIANNVTRECLRKRFHRFGPINNVSVHFRRTGDNYGFVTFKYKEDAYEAIEHGNEDPTQPQYDLSFGGRRMFCQTTYADLDNLHDEGGGLYSSMKSSHEDSFDQLLREAQAKLLRNRRLNGKS